VINKMAQFWMA